ncbi:hypothetical protein Tco_1480970 [Tanacetum coccineum]
MQRTTLITYIHSAQRLLLHQILTLAPELGPGVTSGARLMRVVFSTGLLSIKNPSEGDTCPAQRIFASTLTKPQHLVPGIEVMKPYTTIDKPMFGNIYENDKPEKRFMAILKIKKFFTCTLELVSSMIRHKLVDNNLDKIELKLTHEKITDLERVCNTCIPRSSRVDEKNRIESYVEAQNLH